MSRPLVWQLRTLEQAGRWLPPDADEAWEWSSAVADLIFPVRAPAAQSHWIAWARKLFRMALLHVVSSRLVGAPDRSILVAMKLVIDAAPLPAGTTEPQPPALFRELTNSSFIDGALAMDARAFAAQRTHAPDTYALVHRAFLREVRSFYGRLFSADHQLARGMKP